MKLPVVFRNPATGARLIIDSKEGVARILRVLPTMWVRVR